MSVSPAFRAWIWNGQAFEPEESVPLSDRGFRYGMSLFESVRVSRGVPEFWEGHTARLITACAEREFRLGEEVLPAAEQVFATAEQDGFARIYVTAGDGGLTTLVEQTRVYLFLESRAPTTAESYEVTLSDETYRPMFGGLKTANYWFNAEVLAQAHRGKYDEALLFNEFAELVSACCANVFVVHGERILTPSRSSGARQGVIREWVVRRCKVEERRLRREDVLKADEIFLTNSWLGVMPVSTVLGRPLGHRWIGPKLQAELENRRQFE